MARQPFRLRFARHRGPLSRALAEGPTLVEPSAGDAGPASVGILAAPLSGAPGRWLCAGIAWPPARPADELLALAGDFAGLLGMALAVAEHEARLEDLADHDFLTGCLSRRGLEEALAREIARCERHAAHRAIAFLDLDRFKRINDEQGHREGDRVLAGVGRTLQGAARRYDSVGRYGGDEFVVVMPDTEAEAASRVAARLVASLERAHLDGEGAVGASAGVASWRPHVDGAELVAEADAAMRKAKSRSADQPPTPTG
jgi:diguanylate cyclase (GGDEF)-like protein